MEKYVHRRSDRHLPPVSLIVFAALLCGFALVNLFWPKRENSGWKTANWRKCQCSA